LHGRRGVGISVDRQAAAVERVQVLEGEQHRRIEKDKLHPIMRDFHSTRARVIGSKGAPVPADLQRLEPRWKRAPLGDVLDPGLGGVGRAQKRGGDLLCEHGRVLAEPAEGEYAECHGQRKEDVRE